MPTKTATKPRIKSSTASNKRSKQGHSLKDVLQMKLQALYDVEQQIMKALPKLAKKAIAPELQEAMHHHLRQTEQQVQRLEEVFGILEIRPQKLASGAIRGLSEDAEWVVKNVKGMALDAALIASLRAVEHYEIAGYGAAHEWADLIGERQIAELLEETLREEEETADALTDLALSKVNMIAAQGEDKAKEGNVNLVGDVVADDPAETKAKEEDKDDNEEEIAG